MYRVAAALIGQADAEDARQEASIRAWQSRDALRDDASTRAWLLRITVNICYSWLRGRHGARLRLDQPLAAADDLVALLPDAPGEASHAAAVDLRAAINQLEAPLRVVVALRYYVGLDSTEIGAALGIPPATARTRLRRALSLLRDALATTPRLPAVEKVRSGDYGE